MAKIFLIFGAEIPNNFLLQVNQFVRKYGYPRGVAGRRAAINWLLSQTGSKSRGILYFADDDNTYDLRLFHEILQVPPGKVGMFPVGLVMPWGVASPIVRAGKVVDFIPGQKGHQNFPVAGFATHLSLIHQRKPNMPYLTTRQEEGFLRSLKIT